MIEGYKIDKNERLIIYLNLEFEFGKLNNKKNSIEKTIKDYLLKNKINFKGTIISLVAGGILIGNLIVKKPQEIVNNINNPIIYPSSFVFVPEIQKKDEDVKILAQEEVLDEIPKVIEIQKEIQNNNSIKANKNNSNVNINQNNNINSNQVQDDTNNIVIETHIKEEKVDDMNTYIKVKRQNGNIETIELETYLVGVVAIEMPALFHNEALKAQAIIARTYTLKAISKGIILTDNESTQSYKDNNELRNMWGSNYDNYYTKIKNAVIETKGLYLTYNGNYIEAVYHSTSNGKTENSANVWSNSFPYLISVESPYDKLNPSFYHEIKISYSEISQKLNMEINSNTEFTILELTESNRVKTIQIGNKIFTGLEIRTKLGLRSTDFLIEKQENYLTIRTKGYGHGVGMSQYGANGMAKNGASFKDIIKHYYPGVTIASR